MKINYIAFDSFGVKSMCTLVKTEDITITLDPGIAWETNSFPLPFVRKAALDQKYTAAIKKATKSSDAVVFTHYHWDHVIREPNLYKGKILLIKDPKKNINKSQKGRAAELLPKIKADIGIADGKTFKFGKTKIKFSKALWHGMKGTGLGFIVMVTIDDGKERLVFTSDLNGIYISKYVNLIAKEKPDYIITDGFPSYLLGFVASFKNLKNSIINNINLLKKTNAKLYIIDHHLLRDYRYKEIYYEVYKAAKELKKNVMTAAETKNNIPMVIKAYKRYGATRWNKWKKLTFKELDKMIREAKKKAKNKK